MAIKNVLPKGKSFEDWIFTYFKKFDPLGLRACMVGQSSLVEQTGLLAILEQVQTFLVNKFCSWIFDHKFIILNLQPSSVNLVNS